MISILVLAIALLQPPTPTPTVAGDVPQDRAAASDEDSKADERPTEPTPVSVHQDQPTPHDGQKDQLADNTKRIASYQWWAWFNATVLTVFTVALAATTILQAFV